MHKVFVSLLGMLICLSYFNWDQSDGLDKVFYIAIGVILLGMWVLLGVLDHSLHNDPRD